MDRRCKHCHWWSRHESHGPESFRPCRFPLPESVIGYMEEMEKLFPGELAMPVLMKHGDAGDTCEAFHPFIERGGRYIYRLSSEVGN